MVGSVFVWMLVIMTYGREPVTKDFATKESCLFARSEIIKMEANLARSYISMKCIKVEIPVAK